MIFMLRLSSANAIAFGFGAQKRCCGNLEKAEDEAMRRVRAMRASSPLACSGKGLIIQVNAATPGTGHLPNPSIFGGSLGRALALLACPRRGADRSPFGKQPLS